MNTKKFFFLFFIFLTVFFYLIFVFYFQSIKPTFYLSKNNQSKKDNCECLKEDEVMIKSDHKYFFVKKGTQNYKILKNVTFTCDIHKSLSRGENQSIIAYSLYGTNQRYFKHLETILKQANELYKNFTIRIYHDSSLDKNLICQFECLYDNVDFCNVEYIPLNNSLLRKNKFHNLSFIPPQSWRFLALGDDLIKTALWRDIDSVFTQREIDAVNQWLLSKNFGHIMRDHPHHGTFILAGMWGLKLSQNRELAKQFFTKLQDKMMVANFLKSGVVQKWLDQKFLAVHVYKYIKNISTIHDSYLCKIYKDSIPYPTKRKGNCFVAMGQLTDCFKGKMFPPCPVECRPKFHQDWDRC